MWKSLETLIRLDFLPQEAAKVETRQKMRTFRLGDRSKNFMPGRRISLCLTGTDCELAKGRVTSIIVKNFGDIRPEDLANSGFEYLQQLTGIMNSIYDGLSPDLIISIIDWKYLE